MNSIDAVGTVGQTPPVSLSPTPVQQLPEQRQLIQAITALNKAEYYGENNELTFALDRQTKRPVVRIVDKKTNELIQQIPPEYVIRMAENLDPSSVATVDIQG